MEKNSSEFYAARAPELYAARARAEARKYPEDLNAEREEIPDEAEKLAFIDRKRREFREAFEAAGGDYEEAQMLHYNYHQYCGPQTGFYRDNISKKWRADIEERAFRFGLDKISLPNSWVVWGADSPLPPKDAEETSENKG
ncbi:MAG: hypothetical protein COU11_00965 [Candidatus Harrisonbacteria bacterium CG10_big_fil_rev_8_21_14_0_10_49_15]|uniref:Uncharacterized protein n=1 Tax=Candidatus Harrisonbacteria bacterium CG10_big_fil_rev_8_21_14_0_10_49_15 TaxID=1974587 RepID=A0A2H0UNH3_9BACT|nr:MAG: hypothetical protein COU11_00965 [Candidatus Harrisonbacteria bacterium CG10_big_fil_rev_8_21_14_0_10_49_15]